jgi:hypothetical protein
MVYATYIARFKCQKLCLRLWFELLSVLSLASVLLQMSLGVSMNAEQMAARKGVGRRPMLLAPRPVMPCRVQSKHSAAR